MCVCVCDSTVRDVHSVLEVTVHDGCVCVCVCVCDSTVRDVHSVLEVTVHDGCVCVCETARCVTSTRCWR